MKTWSHPRTVPLPDEIDVSDIDSVKVIKMEQPDSIVSKQFAKVTLFYPQRLRRKSYDAST